MAIWLELCIISYEFHCHQSPSPLPSSLYFPSANRPKQKLSETWTWEKALKQVYSNNENAIKLQMLETVTISYLSSDGTACSLPVRCEYVASLMVWATSQPDHFHWIAVPSSIRITGGLNPLSVSSASMSLFGSTVIVTGTQRRPPLQ